jgi:hypothetical protein
LISAFICKNSVFISFKTWFLKKYYQALIKLFELGLAKQNRTGRCDLIMISFMEKQGWVFSTSFSKGDNKLECFL